jgi:hypothetical protein
MHATRHSDTLTLLGNRSYTQDYNAPSIDEDTGNLWDKQGRSSLAQLGSWTINSPIQIYC